MTQQLSTQTKTTTVHLNDGRIILWISELKACDFENKKFNTQRDFGSSLFSFSQGLWCGAGPMWLFLCVFVGPQIVRAARRFVGDICQTGLAHMQN
jgi:hypothetical protein